ncbi:MAG: Na(+)-translocating NADH-quinone reductase subunit E [Acidobacteriota bacterium]
MTLIVILMTVAIFLLVVLAMAVGVIFNRPCLRGSCGGPEVLGAGGESLSCATCPNRKNKGGGPSDSADRRGLPVLR